MLNAFRDLLCSKLCRHNRRVPTPGLGINDGRQEMAPTMSLLLAWPLTHNLP